jgi:RimJ/RimL family protein N-acetyltransferase
MKPDTNNDPIIDTDRLVLRRWHSRDLPSFSELNADPRVMEFFPATLTPAETEAMVKLIEERIDQHGFGFWAAELKQTQELIGFVGLNVPGYPLPFSPCVEIGWRLAHRFWGQGLAQEAARASLQYGFERLGLNEIVAFTASDNMRSRRVMENLGMLYDPQDDFDHPKIAEGHPLRRHVLYRIKSG